MPHHKPVNISKFRHLYPFESHYLSVKGIRYHYLDEGEGEPLIMIHGNPTWSFYYRVLVKGLSRQYRSIAPDHIGCGLSDKPDANTYDYRLKSRVDDLEMLVDHLKFEKKITLVLHDWGGIIGMALAVRRPESIGRIIILNTAAFFPPAGKRLPLCLRVIRDITAFSIPAVLGLNLFALGALFMAAKKRMPAAVKAGLIAPYNCWNNRIATLKFVQDIPVHPRDPSYTMVKQVDEKLKSLTGLPVLICWGEQDFVFDMDYLAEWRRRFPEAEVHTFSDAGHYVLEDVPDKIVPLVNEFLQKHPLD